MKKAKGISTEPVMDLAGGIDWRLVEEDFQHQAELTRQLADKHPEIGMPTVFIMAGDLVAAEKVDKLFQAKQMTFEAAQAVMGSYARFDWIVKQIEQGIVKPEQAYALLPEVWSSSDPDDTDPRFLKFWKKAYAANDNKCIWDDNEPPLRKKVFTVYRGQDRHLYYEGGLLGIAWTLDKNIAKKFARGAWARQSNRPGEVLTGGIARKDILAFICGRGESEIIADPRRVKIIRKEDV